MANEVIHTLFRSLLVSCLLYACPSWWGFASVDDKQRLQAFMNRAVRFGYLNRDKKDINVPAITAHHKLFTDVTSNEHHVMHHLLPDKRNQTYSMRPRPHEYTLCLLNESNKRTFINRMLFNQI